MGNDNLDIFVKMSAQLGSIDSSIKTLCDRIADHENRLSALEQNKVGLKDSVVALLVKGLVVAVLTIGSLTGAAGLIKQALGLGD